MEHLQVLQTHATGGSYLLDLLPDPKENYKFTDAKCLHMHHIHIFDRVSLELKARLYPKWHAP